MSDGYLPKQTLYKLTFDNPDFEGLEVFVKSVSMAMITKMLGVVDQFSGVDKENFKPEDLEKVNDVFRMFAKMLHRWNVENEDDDGNRVPVPPTFEGVSEQDFDFIMPVIEKSLTAITQAPPPLPGGSPSGETSEAVPPAVVSASASLANSSAPS